jgi:predicted nucleic acid-binding protein
MKRLIDTNILIDHLRGNEKAALFLQDCLQGRHRLTCSVITQIELKSGMRPGEEEPLAAFLSCFEKIAVSEDMAKVAGCYLLRFRKSHGINLADAIIAASARQTGADLYSLDQKHYPMSEIKVIKPY